MIQTTLSIYIFKSQCAHYKCFLNSYLIQPLYIYISLIYFYTSVIYSHFFVVFFLILENKNDQDCMKHKAAI